MSQEEFYRNYRAPEWREFPDLELYMDQVISVLNRLLSPVSETEPILTSTMINNYVKQKMIPAPVNKKYDRRHLALLFMIFHFKRFMQLSDVKLLLDEMIRRDGVEGAYEAFRREFSAEMEEPAELPKKKDIRAALNESARAFAQICRARRVYLDLGLMSEEEKKEKEKREKEAKAAREKAKKEKEEKEKKEKKK